MSINEPPMTTITRRTRREQGGRRDYSRERELDHDDSVSFSHDG